MSGFTDEDEEFFDIVGSGNEPKNIFLDMIRECGATKPTVDGDVITISLEDGICPNLEIFKTTNRTELFCIKCGIFSVISVLEESGVDQEQSDHDLDEMDEFLNMQRD